MTWASTEILTFAIFSMLSLMAKLKVTNDAIQECNDGDL